MVLAGAVEGLFSKLGVIQGYQYPHEPYEPTKRLRRVSSHLSMRQRKPSIVESACLGAHKIPALVAASGSPEALTPETGLPRGTNPSGSAAARNRHSIVGLGWHRLLSQDDAGPSYIHPKQTELPTGTRSDRWRTVPAAIKVSGPLDQDQTRVPNSAPSNLAAFRPPEIQVTSTEPWPAETQRQYASPTSSTSYDFTDLDAGSRAPPDAPQSPFLSSIHRSPSPTLGHTPYYHGSQRRDSPLRASHTPSQSPTNSVSRTNRTVISESYDFTGADRLSPTATHENPEYGAYYSTSPVPIFTYGSTRRNTRDSGQRDAYDATQGAYASTRDTYDTMPDSYDPVRRGGGGPYTAHEQETGLTGIIAEMENYNRDRTPRSMLTPSPTTTVSADGTLDSPCLNRHSTSPSI